MKKFSLGCDQNHEFEGWFADADAIALQLAAGQLDCPYCGSTNLEKRLSAPHLSTPKTKTRITAEQQDTRPPAADPAPDQRSAQQAPRRPDAPSGRPAMLGPPAGEGAAALRMALRALHRKIQTEFTDVGDKFADEARKIHHGTSEQKHIYGTCTVTEQRELTDEGIDILPIPDPLPEH